jgi:hypothetical protein
VAASIQKKNKKKTLIVVLPGKTLKDPVTFEVYARQGLIIKKLFKEFCLPSRRRLQLSK